MQDWSPQQIAAWLRLTPAAAQGVQISHEAIYRTLYIGTRLALPSTLKTHLRSGRGMRASRKARRTGHGRGRLRNMVSIHDRPEQIETRTEVGHWEGDLVMGRRPSAVATLVERATRTVRLVKLDGIKGPDVRAALVQNLLRLAEITVGVDHLGSRSRAVRARTTRPRPWHPRLLLRSPLTMATRLEREHQRDCRTGR